MGARDDDGVKRSTAVNRLAEIADELERSKVWSGSTVVSGHVFGDLLDAPDEVERIEIALVVDEPADYVPWMSHPARLEALASMLRFDRLPMSWWWRPHEWPVWNHAIGRTVCFWSASAGPQPDVFDALAAARSDQLELVAPSDDEQLVAQLCIERDVARRHLEATMASFYDREWRHEHKGDGVYPADHLWWATSGYLDLDDAVNAAGD
jgi:hypothetical protein